MSTERGADGEHADAEYPEDIDAEEGSLLGNRIAFELERIRAEATEMTACLRRLSREHDERVAILRELPEVDFETFRQENEATRTIAKLGGQLLLLCDIGARLDRALVEYRGRSNIRVSFYELAPDAIRAEATQEQLRAMTPERFHRSAYWAFVRIIVHARHEGACCTCGATGSLEVHHRPDCGAEQGFETVFDLILLCGFCHRIATEFSRGGVKLLLRQPSRNGHAGRNGRSP